VLKAFQRYMYARRTELETWRNREALRDREQVLQGIAEKEAKELALLGLCAVCGDDLPCQACGMPAVELDGRGGIRPVSA
jgi:hypothetical protein